MFKILLIDIIIEMEIIWFSWNFFIYYALDNYSLFFTSVDQPCKNTGWTQNILFLEQVTAALAYNYFIIWLKYIIKINNKNKKKLFNHYVIFLF